MPSPVYERIKSGGSLPSPAPVIFEIFRLSRDPEAKIEDIVAMVESDPATAGRVLKFANSAFAGVRQQVGDVQRAVVLMGMKSVVNVSMGFSLISMHKRGECDSFDYEAFWSESAVRAATARHLARAPLDAGEAFACGLLSQIGRLALATVFPKEYGEILGFCKANCMAKLVDLERRMFEIDHNQLTAEMLADWQLPREFSLAALAQDAPHRSELEADSAAGRLAHALHLGGLMGALLERQEVRREYLVSVLAAAHRMNIPRDDFPTSFDTISQEWQQMGEIFPIRTHPVPTWEELYEASRQPMVAAPPSARMLGQTQGWLMMRTP